MPRKASPEQRRAWHLAHQEHCGCRSMPPGLAALAQPDRKRPAPDLRALLAGGDRRSVARSRIALAAVVASPGRVAELAALAGDPDWLVALRALDLLEKLAHQHPDWVLPHRRLFLGPLADAEQWEFRLQVVRALPLLRWTPRQHRRALEILLRDVEHPQKFVRAWALDSLATFALRDAALLPAAERCLRAFERSGSKALATRARHVRERLARARRRRERAARPAPRPR